jgi:hypothetical protein
MELQGGTTTTRVSAVSASEKAMTIYGNARVGEPMTASADQ